MFNVWPLLVIMVAALLAGCATANSHTDAEDLALAKARRANPAPVHVERAPRPAAQQARQSGIAPILLAKVPRPKCETAASGFQAQLRKDDEVVVDPVLVDAARLETERDCYRKAEHKVRSRLHRLIDAVNRR